MRTPSRFWKALTAIVASLAVLTAATPARATNHIVQLHEALGSCAANPAIQFVEMNFPVGQNLWHDGGNPCAKLVFFDANGNPLGQFLFDHQPTNDPGNGNNTALAATQAFANLPSAPVPDFIIPANLAAPDGKVCFTNVDPVLDGFPICGGGSFIINVCLSYGAFTGNTVNAGPPAPALPTTGAQSLARFQNFNSFGDGGQFNADFQLATPSPRNSAGSAGTLAVNAGACEVSAPPPPPPCPPGIPDADLGSALSASTSGSTVGAPNQFSGTCGGAGAPERVFTYTAPVAGSYIVDMVGSNYDTMLYVRDAACTGAQLACNDDFFGLQSRVEVNLTAGQQVFLFADGFGASQGNFTLNVTGPAPPVGCGNGAPDAGEECDDAAGNGTNGSCCNAICKLKTAGTICRADAGVCDLAEQCDGVTASCPVDAKRTNGTVCHSHPGDLCDSDELCDGSSNDCPADVVAPAGTVCRAAADLCDAAEACDGVSGECPSDAAAATGTECRAAVGTCDVAESCDGTSTVCPTDELEQPGASCRASAGACDLAEVCDGGTAQCPSDAKVSSGTVCRTSGGVCDPAEVCDGAGDLCSADLLSPPGTLCRAAAGVCDVPESCDGSAPACPADGGLPDGDADTVCDAVDNCVDDPNTDQADGDSDDAGDVCDPCTGGVLASKPLVKMTKFTTGAGDDTLTVQGTLTFASAPTLAPDLTGARVLLQDALGSNVFDVTVPPGPFSTVTKTGWKRNGSGTSFTYGNPLPLGGVVSKMIIKTSTKAPNVVKFIVKGSKGAFATLPLDIPVKATLVLDPPVATTGECGDALFPGAPAPKCTFNTSGSTLTCK